MSTCVVSDDILQSLKSTLLEEQKCQGQEIQKNFTLFRLAEALGQGSSRERAELCNSLHTCHRKCRNEPPGDRVNITPVTTGSSNRILHKITQRYYWKQNLKAWTGAYYLQHDVKSHLLVKPNPLMYVDLKSLDVYQM